MRDPDPEEPERDPGRETIRRLRVSSSVIETVILSTIVAAPLAFGCVDRLAVSLLEATGFGLCLIALFRRQAAPAPVHLMIGLGIMIAIGLAQLCSPVLPDAPRFTEIFTADAQATQEALLLWSSLGCLAWCATRALRDAAAARRMAWAFFLAASAVAIVGLAHKAVGARALYGVRPIPSAASPFGPYYNRDHAASIIGMGLCVGAAIFRSRMRLIKIDAFQTLPLAQIAQQAGIFLLLWVCAAGLWVCASRGAFVALAAAGCALVALTATGLPDRLHRWMLYLAVAVVVGLGALTIRRNLVENRRPGAKIDASAANRISFFRSGMRMLADAPYLGWGLGTFPSTFSAYEESSIYGLAEHAHNDWLEWTVQGGLPALLGWAWLILATIFAGARTWRDARSSEMRSLLGGVLAASLFFSAHCVVDFPAQIPANAAVFLLLLGWLAAAPAWAHKQRPQEHVDVQWDTLRGSAAGVLCVLTLLAAKPAAAGWFSASTLPRQQDRRAERLTRAWLWDRRPSRLNRLAYHYLQAGDAAPKQGAASWRRGLQYATLATREEPLNPDYLFMTGALLWRLERKADATELIQRARTLRSLKPKPPEI